jgi:hypothetical protein
VLGILDLGAYECLVRIRIDGRPDGGNLPGRDLDPYRLAQVKVRYVAFDHVGKKAVTEMFRRGARAYFMISKSE